MHLFFSTGINIVAGFLVLRWVEPEEIGVWQMLLIINSYALIGNLGITTGLARELPFLLGRGEKRKALNLASTTKAYTLFCSISTLSILLIGFIIFYFVGKNNTYLWSFTTIMLVLSINFFKDYVLTLFRTNKAFLKLSISYLIQGCISIILLPIIYYYKFSGFLIFTASTSTISLLLLMTINPIKVDSKFEFQNFKNLFKIGMPLFVMSYLYGVSKTFLKFAILYYGGVLLLGLFAPVFAIRNGINTLPKIISQYIYPKLTYKLGVSGNSSILWKPVRNISFLLLITLSVAIMPVYYYMPDILQYFFPKYVESLFACRMALLSGVIFGSFIGVISLNSVRGYKERLIITMSYLVLSSALPFTLPVLFTNKMEGIAWSILLIDVFYFIIAYILTRKKLLYG